MRVTTLGTTNSMLNYITSGESKYYELSAEASSGLKVTEPSDDPSATKSILNIKTQLNQMTSYLSNMKTSQNELDVLDASMSSVTTSIQSATDLATQAANGTYSATDLKNIKVQIDQIIQNVLDSANTNYNGTYIFSGTATSTQTYKTTTNAATGAITDITYQGTPSTDNYERYTTISDGVAVAVNTTGSSVFGSYSTDSATGVVTATGLLGTLVNLSNALGNGGTTTVNGTTVSVGDCLTGLDSALDTVSVTRTKFAAVSSKFKMTESSITSTQTTLKSYKSDLQNADLSEVLTDLATQQNALQATMKVTSQLLGQTTLLDYL